jgi:ESS family glutamate:Na+ symporter
VVQLDFVQTLACGGLVLLLGHLLRRLWPPLARYNLPEPVVGGLVVAALLTFSRQADGSMPLLFDTALQSPLMIAFFTTLGFGASLSVLKAGGPHVVLFLGVCTLLAVLQNVVGGALAWAMGLPPLFGVLAGSVALTGGPGTALAFAPDFQAAGVASASSVAISAAMGGIVLGGLTGGPVGTFLIERHRLAADHRRPVARGTPALAPGSVPTNTARAPTATGTGFDAVILLKHVVAISVAMGLGTLVTKGLAAMGVTLPAYIGAMLVAAAVRNVDDKKRFLRLDVELLDALGTVALSLFLAMALMTLKLWELLGVALPLLLLLLVQTVLMLAVAMTLMFRLMGKDYDAAIMSAGLCGFMLGTTANAMANMEALTARYGAAPRAYLVVPIVGACFIDFTNSLLITTSLNLLK